MSLVRLLLPLHVGVDELDDEASEDEGDGEPLDGGDVVAEPQHAGQDCEELTCCRHCRACKGSEPVDCVVDLIICHSL